MRLFVANPTLQHREFQYAVGQTRHVLKIAPGGREQIPGDLAGTNLHLIRQLEALGAVPNGAVHAGGMPKGLVYEVLSNPIEADLIDDDTARQEVAPPTPISIDDVNDGTEKFSGSGTRVVR